MPKSVLRYDVDKDLTWVWYSVITQSYFPNKTTDRPRRVKYLILSLLLHYELLEKLVTYIFSDNNNFTNFKF